MIKTIKAFFSIAAIFLLTNESCGMDSNGAQRRPLFLMERPINSYTPDVVSPVGAKVLAQSFFKSVSLNQPQTVSVPKVSLENQQMPRAPLTGVSLTSMEKHSGNSLSSKQIGAPGVNQQSSFLGRHQSQFKAEMKEFMSEESRDAHRDLVRESNNNKVEQLLHDPLSKDGFQSKMDEVRSGIHRALKVLDACADPYSKGANQQRLEFLKLTVPEPSLNSELVKIKTKISKILFDKNGAPVVPGPSEIQKLQKLSDEFHAKTENWRMYSSHKLEKELRQPSSLDQALLSNKSLYEKISTNKVNRDIENLYNLCEQNNYQKARDIVSLYHGKLVTEKPLTAETRNAYSIADRLYREKFQERYDYFGIDKRFVGDPAYDRIVKTLELSEVPNVKANDSLSNTIADRNVFFDKFSIGDGSMNRDIADKVIEITATQGQDAAAKYVIDFFSKDSNDVAMRYAQREWLTKDGLPKFCTFEQAIDFDLRLPKEIQLARYAPEREILYHLCTIDRSCPEGIAAFKQGINYLRKSLSGDENALCYRSLARGVAFGAKYKETSEALLQCKNLIPELLNEQQKALYSKILAAIADSADTLYNPSSSVEQQLKAKDLLLALDSQIGALQGARSESAMEYLQLVAGRVQNNSALKSKYGYAKTMSLPSFREIHGDGVKQMTRYFDKNQRLERGTSIALFSNKFEPIGQKQKAKIEVGLAQDFLTSGHGQVEMVHGDFKADEQVLKDIMADQSLSAEVDRVISSLKQPDSLIDHSYFEAKHDAFDKALLQAVESIEKWQDMIVSDDNNNNASNLVKYDKIVVSEALKKTIQLGYEVRHPIQSAYHFVDGTAKLIRALERILCAVDPRYIKALSEMKNAPAHAWVKGGVDLIFDGVVFHNLGKSCGILKQLLSETQNELRAISTIKNVVADPKKLNQINTLKMVVANEIGAIEAIEQTSKIVVQDLNQAQKIEAVSKLRTALVEIAAKKDMELANANIALPRTLELAKDELVRRVAVLEMKYGKETVDEALSLFHMSDATLVKNVKTVDFLDHMAESLNKINSNSRWKTFKYDAARNGKVDINSIDEAIAGVACETQGILNKLRRSLQNGEEFIEEMTNKAWDVKTPPAYSQSGEYIFNAEKFIRSVKKPLIYNPQENFIINVSYLNEKELKSLLEELARLDMNDLSRIVVVHAYDETIGKSFLNSLREELCQ